MCLASSVKLYANQVRKCKGLEMSPTRVISSDNAQITILSVGLKSIRRINHSKRYLTDDVCRNSRF